MHDLTWDYMECVCLHRGHSLYDQKIVSVPNEHHGNEILQGLYLIELKQFVLKHFIVCLY